MNKNSFGPDDYYKTHAADFWDRLLAMMVDGFILIALSLPFVFIFGWAPNSAFSSIIGWLYFALQESSAKQATFGKQRLGIVVTDLNGNRISFFEATVRYFMKFFSYILFIGFLIQPFTKKRQALHDMIAGCLVMNKR